MKLQTAIIPLLLISTSLCFSGSRAKNPEPQKAKFILDMVHHNPGEARYKSVYDNPAVIKEMGYNGKVFFLFDSPLLAINWESVDPEILPKGSPDRAWVDAKAAAIHKTFSACKKLDLSVFAMSDLILFPKRLLEKEGLGDHFGDPNNPKIQKLLRAQIDEMFKQFPEFDGLVVRIGETYLQDAPFHKGSILNKSNPEKTIIPLIQLLREEICVKRNKQLIFRTWGSFDRDAKVYQKVSDAIEPHANLTISIKHCEGDFHRANPFSKVIGMGRHKQIIEVQCAREYEGKGAYPNYIAHGVIEGFEEYENMPEEKINSIREFTETKPELFAGIWTWTRGGGWRGPYITNEMWCDLNAWVMAQWANDTTQSEESLCYRYATERLHLQEKDLIAFRKLCLLSADAVIRGRNTVQGDMNPWWTRDQGIAWPKIKNYPACKERLLAQKDESIKMWKEILALTQSIQWADQKTCEYAIGSAYYGLDLYIIYRALVYLAVAEKENDTEAMKKWIKAYDQAWADYEQLPAQYPKLATLYTQDYNLHVNPAKFKVDALRKKLGLTK